MKANKIKNLKNKIKSLIIINIVLLSTVIPFQLKVNATETPNIIDVEKGVLVTNTKVSNVTTIKDGEVVSIVDTLKDNYEVVYKNDFYYIPKDNILVTEVESYDKDNFLISKKYVDNKGFLKNNIKLKVDGTEKQLNKGESLLIKDYSEGNYKVLQDNLLFTIPKKNITFNKEDINKTNLVTKDNRKEAEEIVKKKRQENIKKLYSEDDIKGLRSVQQELMVNSTKRLGVKYVWGGTSETGLDCSGFVQKVYGESGIKLPRHSGDQAKVGTRVQEGQQMKTGDLLFFGPTKIDHVGMYLGGDKFIHASGSKGQVVIDSIYSSYVKNQLSHVMRLLD